MASLRARIGYLVTDNTLLYLHGGYSVAEIDFTSSYSENYNCLQICDNVRGRDGYAFSESHTVDGWTAGFGAEHKLNNDTSVFVEYAYTDYGSETIGYGHNSFGSVDIEVQTVKIGVNFKLN
jgi:opacity protein-like surface antigen